VLKYIPVGVVAVLAVFVVGCGSVGGKPKIKVDPIKIPGTQKTFENNTTKEDYLKAVRDARSEKHDCGHYRLNADGSYALDEHGGKITDYNGSDWMPAVENDQLHWNESLYKAAYEHNIDMLSMGENVSHTGSGGKTDRTAQINHLGRGSTVEERVLGNGYKYEILYENLTAGIDTDTAEEAVEKWLGSAGHCKHLMDPDVTEMGMSHVYDPDSVYKHYWTQDLAKPAAEEKGIF